MARYEFVCPPCEEHKEEIHREVLMSISHFSNGGNNQLCDVCGKPMKHLLGMPAVVYKGKGFYKTDYPKQVPQNRQDEMVSELTDHYVERTIRSGAYDAALDKSEDVVVDRYRDTKTGKKVHKPVHVPAIKDD